MDVYAALEKFVRVISADEVHRTLPTLNLEKMTEDELSNLAEDALRHGKLCSISDVMRDIAADVVDNCEVPTRDAMQELISEALDDYMSRDDMDDYLNRSDTEDLIDERITDQLDEVVDAKLTAFKRDILDHDELVDSLVPLMITRLEYHIQDLVTSLVHTTLSKMKFSMVVKTDQ